MNEQRIDRADRRLLDGKFDNCDDYLKSKVNTKTLTRIAHVTHVNSDYVNAMQMSDLISGAIRDNFVSWVKSRTGQKVFNTFDRDKDGSFYTGP